MTETAADRRAVQPPAPGRPTAHRRPRPRARPLGRLRAEIGKAVVGQDAIVTGLVIALLCRGHVLLEGVPGVAKTLLVRAHRRRRSRWTPSGCSSRPT